MSSSTHIDYVVDLVGDDHVGLGLDYYKGQSPVVDDDEAARLYAGRIAAGDWRPETYSPPPHHFPDGIATPRELRNLTRRLLERGYGEQTTRKILGGNWVRVFAEVWGE